MIEQVKLTYSPLGTASENGRAWKSMEERGRQLIKSNAFP